jgi:hypothetical protein
MTGVGSWCCYGRRVEVVAAQLGAREITPRRATAQGSAAVLRAAYAPTGLGRAFPEVDGRRSRPGAAMAADGDLDLAAQNHEGPG